MKQFLTINDNGDMLNIDMIAAITPTRNGCTILTKDGREFHSVFNLARNLKVMPKSVPWFPATVLPHSTTSATTRRKSGPARWCISCPTVLLSRSSLPVRMTLKNVRPQTESALSASCRHCENTNDRCVCSGHLLKCAVKPGHQP